MGFDEHFDRVTAAADALRETIEAAAKAGIVVGLERQQYSGYFLPQITMSRPVPVRASRPPFPRD